MQKGKTLLFLLGVTTGFLSLYAQAPLWWTETLDTQIVEPVLGVASKDSVKALIIVSAFIDDSSDIDPLGQGLAYYPPF
ncbi:hypothetical protein GF359_08295 [candidate division WOR-3 bacterium]|uniref:Uncharacterized protein n=1 Tax=candidate division WOR-3 bacterium TaxID=2052148 RepID=A0A9D5QDM2_UNCW3|nr:hypothetical protein [candidate division WOR-3 bacterium]MBD3365201.1 hypothetical protein [candidate division WOR-3 bacterium]